MHRDRKERVWSAESAPKTMTLDITAVDQRTLDSVRQSLRQMIDGMVAKPVEITDRLVADISDGCRQEIQSLESTGVNITVGMLLRV